MIIVDFISWVNAMNAATPKYILGIDMLRFVAAVLVMLFHYCFLMGIVPSGAAGRASFGAVAFPELYGATNVGWVGVQIFFVISGFVIAYSGEKATPFSFVRSRIVRLGPGAWICAPITLVAAVMLGILSQEDMMRAFRHSMLFLPWGPWIDGSYWTLGIEVSFYAVVAALIALGDFNRVRLASIFIGCVSALFWLFLAMSQTSAEGLKLVHESRWLQTLLVQHGVFFALGVLLWSSLIQRRSASNTIWIVGFCVAGCLQVASHAQFANIEFHTDYAAVVPCLVWLGAVGALILAVKHNHRLHQLPVRVVRMIQAGGAMTYPLYLLHQVVGAALMGWLVRGGTNRWAALGVAMASMLFAAWIIATYLEPRLQAVTKGAIDGAWGRFLATVRRRAD